MSLYVPSADDFKWQVRSTGTTRPAAAYGTTITPGTAPTMGSWAQVLAAGSVTQDSYGIMINFNSGSSSATIRNYLADIGIDNAGGTSYRVLAPYLLCGHSAPYNVGSGGIWYYFPVFIPAGSSLACRAMGNVTTTFRCNITLYGQPRRPDSIRVGSKIFAFGEDTANARGTTIVSGTTGEGSYYQMGSATTMKLWWWQMGYSAADTTMTAAAHHMDLAAGDATDKKLLITENPVIVSSAEQINNLPMTAGCVSTVAPGSLIYIRDQLSAAVDTNANAMAYGVGG